MNIADFSDDLQDFENTYKQQLKNAVEKSLFELDEIKSMKKMVPSFDEILVHKGWSGFNDGDAEYAIFRYGLDVDEDDELDDYDVEIYRDMLLDPDKQSEAESYLENAYDMFTCSSAYCNSDFDTCHNDQMINELLLLDASDRYDFMEFYGQIAYQLKAFIDMNTKTHETFSIKVK